MNRDGSSECPFPTETSNGNVMNDNVDYLGPDETSTTAVHKIRTAGRIFISSELFENLYLNPKLPAQGGLQKIIGNPTPILSPLTCALMGWRGAEHFGAADIGVYFFYGGVSMVIGGFMQFLLANTFSSCVFLAFGALWMSYAATLQPVYGAYAAYSPDYPTKGLESPGFSASFGFFWVFFVVLCFLFLIASIRTNIVLVWILFTVVIGCSLVVGSFFHNAAGNLSAGSKCLVGGGAVLFAACIGGWYFLAALLLAAVDFPYALPVGDLSRFVPPGSRNANKDKV